MNIMIFAAGMGTRLKPLTDIIPKALVPVRGKPLLQHVLERVDGDGNTIVINIHHHADQIRNFIDTTRSHWKASILLSDESDQLLETGGGIKKAASLFPNDEPILIHNVDILSNIDLQRLSGTISHHPRPDNQHPAEATLLVSPRKTQRYLLFDDDMRLVGWTNIATGEVKSPFPEIASLNGTNLSNNTQHPSPITLYAFSGIHCITKDLIAAMDSWPDRFPIMDFYLQSCKSHVIRGIVKNDLRLLDVGKLDTLESSTEFIKSL